MGLIGGLLGSMKAPRSFSLYLPKGLYDLRLIPCCFLASAPQSDSWRCCCWKVVHPISGLVKGWPVNTVSLPPAESYLLAPALPLQEISSDRVSPLVRECVWSDKFFEVTFLSLSLSPLDCLFVGSPPSFGFVRGFLRRASGLVGFAAVS